MSGSRTILSCWCMKLLFTVHVLGFQFEVTKYVPLKQENVWKSCICMVLFMFSLPPESLSATEIETPNFHDCQSSSIRKNSWTLPNGQVNLPSSIISFPNHEFYNPILLGSGGGGAVFSVQDSKGPSKFALKVSWLKSSASVQHECDILQTLEQTRARHVETCIGSTKYLDTTGKDMKDRVMIALQPVVENSVASLSSLVDDNMKRHCVQSIIETLVDCLASNVVTTDVQVLINTETGDLRLIDLTEARQINPQPSFLDLAVASSFCSEMISLIPNEYLHMASEILLQELKSCESQGINLSTEIFELLESQSSIMSNDDTLNFVKSKSRLQVSY